MTAVSVKNAHTQEYNQIIGIMINGTVYSGNQALIAFKQSKNFQQLISKALVRLMVNCDMGNNWERLLEMPVIFYFDEKGEAKWP